MRIDRIRIDAFGRIRDFDTGPESLGGLVVVLGPNEAGKSTLFTFLTTALYGFQPATRERNPHVPWGTDEARGSVRLQLDGDGCADVERILRSQPASRLTVEGKTTDLRNQALPWVEHVPRTVFRQVFAITLGELAGLDADTWARIQDKMVGSMGAADLLSARMVAEELEREAGEIWRPNRRGNQRLRDVQREVRDLRGRRTTAHERDTGIRCLVAERDVLRADLAEVREHRQLDRVEVDRAQSLLPVKRQLDRIATLRTEGGDRNLLQGLPLDPTASFAELDAERRRLEDRRASCERHIAEQDVTIQQAAEAAGSLLAHREDVGHLVARATASGPDRVRVVQLPTEIMEVESRLDAESSTMLEGSWRDVPTSMLAAIPSDLIRDRISQSTPTSREGEASRAAPPILPPLVMWTAAAAGTVLFIVGLLTDRLVATSLGAASVAAVLTAIAVAARARGPGTGERAGSTETPRDIADLLSGVPVGVEHLSSPGDALVAGLERLRDLATRHVEATRELAAAEERLSSVDAAAETLAEALRIDAGGDAETISRDLDRAVRDAERLQEAAANADRELRRLRLERDSATEALGRTESALSKLTVVAERLADGDIRRGLEMANRRIAAHGRSDQLEDELLRSHPDLAELQANIDRVDRAPGGWSVDEEGVARARARIESHDEEIEKLLTRGEALDRDAEHLRELETVDSVDSEIVSLREEASRLERERDRKWVLAQLLREADRRFREEHQPDLLRRAGSYLDHLTGGRYERLIVDEHAGDHLFHLVGPALPAPVPLGPPVSTGTLEQAYLSLRLAIVDHLDRGGARLPLFVDEVFVNWDATRRERGLEVLASIAGTRQVFVFTCHPAVASEIERRGGRILELTRTG